MGPWSGTTEGMLIPGKRRIAFLGFNGAVVRDHGRPLASQVLFHSGLKAHDSSDHPY